MNIDFTTSHKRLASGRLRVYYYTRAGTRFFATDDAQEAPPYSEALKAAYARAAATAPALGDCAAFFADYLASRRFGELSPATQDGYRRDLALAAEAFGDTSIEDMHTLAFRASLVDWHDELAGRSPRRADLAMIAVRMALEYATRRGRLLHNPADNLQTAWQRPDDKRPWPQEDIDLFLKDAPQETADAFLTIFYSALRRTDAVALAWPAIGRQEIQWQTSKSRGRRTVIIPLVDEAVAFFAGLRMRQMRSPLGLQRTVITGARGGPVTPAMLHKMINERAHDLGIENSMHRLRNNYASLLVKAGFDDSSIAGVMGWTVQDVAELKRIYVHKDIIVAAQVRQLREARPQ
jgi:site-specific recombinase XerD